MVLVPAGSSLILRRADGTAVTMVTLADVSADLIDDLPDIPVMSLEDPAERHAGVVELVTSSGAAWAEAELRGDLLRVTGDPSDTLVQRRASRRRPDHRPYVGVAEVAAEPGSPLRRTIRFGGEVLNISSAGVLLRAVPQGEGHRLPSGVTTVTIEADMPWGRLPATVRVVDQRSDLLRGEFTGLTPSDTVQLVLYCSGR